MIYNMASKNSWLFRKQLQSGKIPNYQLKEVFVTLYLSGSNLCKIFFAIEGLYTLNGSYSIQILHARILVQYLLVYAQL